MKFHEPRPTTASVFADKAAPSVSIWLQEAIKPLSLETVKKITNDFDATNPLETMRGMLRAAAIQCMNENNNKIDAYKMSRNFEDSLEWPVDVELVTLLNTQVQNTISFAVNQATREWVLRTGVRFNAKPEDNIHFRQEDDVVRAGHVVSVNKGLAVARVLVHATGRELNVYAEELETG